MHNQLEGPDRVGGGEKTKSWARQRAWKKEGGKAKTTREGFPSKNVGQKNPVFGKGKPTTRIKISQGRKRTWGCSIQGHGAAEKGRVTKTQVAKRFEKG